MTKKPTAIDVFIARKAEIDTMLKRLQAFSDNHFDTAPDEVNWGDVGSLGHVAEQLKEITDFVFGEGEYAE